MPSAPRALEPNSLHQVSEPHTDVIMLATSVRELVRKHGKDGKDGAQALAGGLYRDIGALCSGVQGHTVILENQISQKKMDN